VLEAEMTALGAAKDERTTELQLMSGFDQFVDQRGGVGEAYAALKA
jgi:hypothetical protein